MAFLAISKLCAKRFHLSGPRMTGSNSRRDLSGHAKNSYELFTVFLSEWVPNHL